MPKSKRNSSEVRIHIEPVAEIDEATMNIFCRILSRGKYNAEQLPQAAVKNVGGEFDFIYGKEQPT